MEPLYDLPDTHNRPISTLGYNASRREILAGFEDGMIKAWEADTGILTYSTQLHKGWLTSFFYWPQMKMILSGSNDGLLVFCTGNTVAEKVLIGKPIYALEMNHRRKQLLLGTSVGLLIYPLDEDRTKYSYLDSSAVHHQKEHTDIVKCIAIHENKIFTGGFDQRLVIYDGTLHSTTGLRPLHVLYPAHDAGISQLCIALDIENTPWIVTGSFDKSVKIWSSSGKVVHRLNNFMSPISGVAFLPRTGTIWVTAGSAHPMVFDPRSGENITEFCDMSSTDENSDDEQDHEKYQLQLLKYFPEQNLLIGSTSRRHLMSWKFQPNAAATTLRNTNPVISLAFTCKFPILIFSSDQSGELMKWERKPSNHFAFNAESLKTGESMRRLLEQQLAARQRQMEQKNLLQAKQTRSVTHKKSDPKNKRKIFRRISYVEEFDVLVAACEDGNIYVFGYDDKAVQALNDMAAEAEKKSQVDEIYQMLVSEDELRDGESVISVNSSEQRYANQVTQRVAGFTCKQIFMEHQKTVTTFACVRNYDEHFYLISAGWDQRICIWNMETGELVDVFRDPQAALWEEREWAADDVIIDMDYSEERREFAYSAADNVVYIRRFSPLGTEMTLLNTLQGHRAEISCVKWHVKRSQWLTASEDHSIKLWAGTGMNDCLVSMNVGGPVSCLCLDYGSDAIVVAVKSSLRVMDPEGNRIVQINKGHTDEIYSVIHIPQTNHYVTCSADGLIKIWNAWIRPNKKV